MDWSGLTSQASYTCCVAGGHGQWRPHGGLRGPREEWRQARSGDCHHGTGPSGEIKIIILIIINNNNNYCHHGTGPPGELKICSLLTPCCSGQRRRDGGPAPAQWAAPAARQRPLRLRDGGHPGQWQHGDNVSPKLAKIRLLGAKCHATAFLETQWMWRQWWTLQGKVGNRKIIWVQCFPSALKIHISLETKLLLDIHGCFKCEHRGSIEIKVKFITF